MVVITGSISTGTSWLRAPKCGGYAVCGRGALLGWVTALSVRAITLAAHTDRVAYFSILEHFEEIIPTQSA